MTSCGKENMFRNSTISSSCQGRGVCIFPLNRGVKGLHSLQKGNHFGKLSTFPVLQQSKQTGEQN
eukprot:363235-Chlamydomonas_euryale.AAC.10